MLLVSCCGFSYLSLVVVHLLCGLPWGSCTSPPWGCRKSCASFLAPALLGVVRCCVLILCLALALLFRDLASLWVRIGVHSLTLGLDSVFSGVLMFAGVAYVVFSAAPRANPSAIASRFCRCLSSVLCPVRLAPLGSSEYACSFSVSSPFAAGCPPVALCRCRRGSLSFPSFFLLW